MSPPSARLPRLLRLTVRRAAYALGLHVGKFPATDSLQGHLKHFFRKAGINCVLDVGAHHGEYSDQIREIGYKGRIVSFEPAAGGEERGEHGLPIDVDLLLAVRGAPLARPPRRTARARAARERVRIRRLDQIFDECIAGIARPRVFLKMDTQGWDLEVLEGARGIVDRLVGLQSEMAVKQIYGGMPKYTAALEHYAALGFEVTGMYPVSRDADGLQLVEFDCVFVRAGAVAP